MRYCEQCGTQTGESSFCGTCGARLDGGPTNQPSKAMDTSYAQPMVPAKQPSYGPPMGQIAQPGFAPMPSIMPSERSYLKWFALIYGASFIGGILVVVGFVALLASIFTEDFGSYGFLLFIGFMLMGVGGVSRLIYGYHNFNDFRLLNRAGHGWPDDSTEPALGLILFFVFSPLAIFLKYNQLYNHLTQKHSDEEGLPPKPLYVILIMIVPYIFYFTLPSLIFSATSEIFYYLIGLVVIGSPLIMLFFENNWQKAMNKHIGKHKNFQMSQSPSS